MQNRIRIRFSISKTITLQVFNQIFDKFGGCPRTGHREVVPHCCFRCSPEFAWREKYQQGCLAVRIRPGVEVNVLHSDNVNMLLGAAWNFHSPPPSKPVPPALELKRAIIASSDKCWLKGTPIEVWDPPPTPPHLTQIFDLFSGPPQTHCKNTYQTPR